MGSIFKNVNILRRHETFRQKIKPFSGFVGGNSHNHYRMSGTSGPDDEIACFDVLILRNRHRFPIQRNSSRIKENNIQVIPKSGIRFINNTRIVETYFFL